MGGRPVWSEEALDSSAVARWGGPEGLTAEIARRAGVKEKKRITAARHEAERAAALAAVLAPLLVAFDANQPGPGKTFITHGKLDELPLTAQRLCQLAHLEFCTVRRERGCGRV